MSEGIKRQFMLFLADNDAYDDFCYELYTQKKLSFEEYMKRAEDAPRKLIEVAFTWHGKRGNDHKQANYWLLLDNKWREYLDN